MYQGFIDSPIHPIEKALADLACSLDDQWLSAADFENKIQEYATKQQNQLLPLRVSLTLGTHSENSPSEWQQDARQRFSRAQQQIW